jgi:hypothetical protein
MKAMKLMEVIKETRTRERETAAPVASSRRVVESAKRNHLFRAGGFVVANSSARRDGGAVGERSSPTRLRAVGACTFMNFMFFMAFMLKSIGRALGAGCGLT